MGTHSSSFVAADSNRVALPAGDFALRIVGIHDGFTHRTIECTEELTSLPVMSPDGSMVAAGTRAGSIVVWSAETGELLHRFVDQREVRAVAFSPDGQHLVSGGLSGTAIAWHIGSSTAAYTLTGLGPSVAAVAFSPDGTSLATGGQDKIVRIWDAVNGTLRLAHPCETGVVSGLAFSPDGTRIACGTFDETAHVRVLDAHHGTERWRGMGHEMGVTTVTFSPDGQCIASGSQDMNVVLWKAECGQIIRTLEEPNHDIDAVAFAPDGSFLIAITRVFDDFITPEEDETQWGSVVWDPTSWTAVVRLGAEDEVEDASDAELD